MKKEYPLSLRPKIFFLIAGTLSALWPFLLELIAMLRGLNIQPQTPADTVIKFTVCGIFVLGGLWIIVWALRWQISISATGLEFRAFDTWKTPWDNIDAIDIGASGLTIKLKNPLQPEHKISKLGAKRRLPLLFQAKHALLEDFKEYAPELFKDAGQESL